MDTTKTGWLREYIELKWNLQSQSPPVDLNEIDEALYQHFQPTGLLYGHPVKIPGYSFPKSISSKGKIQLLLADSFSKCHILISHATETNLQTDLFFEDMVSYYNAVFPGISSSLVDSIIKRKQKGRALENILEHRVELDRGWKSTFWSECLHNSLLFLDLVYYAQWKAKRITKDQLKELRHDMSFIILKVIAAAAHANGRIDEEEQDLFRFFLKSAHIDKSDKREAETLLHYKVDLKDLDLSCANTWILKKYILELAILTMWADQVIEESELEFIKDLNQKLGLDPHESESSMMAIESFVLQHWEEVHYLRAEHSYQSISGKFIKRMTAVTRKFSGQIGVEINESKELVRLLTKSRKEKLSEEEKEKVRAQLIDVLKTIPLIAMIGLPGTCFTLPVLLEILPKGVLPSAFQD